MKFTTESQVDVMILLPVDENMISYSGKAFLSFRPEESCICLFESTLKLLQAEQWCILEVDTEQKLVMVLDQCKLCCSQGYRNFG